MDETELPALPHKDLYRQIAGALKMTIAAHGPITQQYVPSAAKRITRQIESRQNEVAKQRPLLQEESS